MNYELFSHPEQNKNIYLIDMTREHGYFSEMVQKGIAKYIKEQKKILLIINKKWFASWLLCTSCGYIPQCNQCSVSIGYHTVNDTSKAKSWKWEMNPLTHQLTHSLIGLCHICKTIYDLPQHCHQCHKTDTFKLYGLTIQKTEQWIQQEFGINPLIIQSETVSSQAKINKLLPDLEKAQVVIGTNIINQNLTPTPLLSERGNLDINKRKNTIWIGGYLHTLAKENRKNTTSSEEYLWSLLRNRQIEWLKFRRQHPLQWYIADFYCAEHGLIIEIDGWYHSTLSQQEYDQARDKLMKDKWYRILRFSNKEIENGIEKVLHAILSTINKLAIATDIPLWQERERGWGVGYDLIIILAADQSLWLPDYSVRQDTFVQLYHTIQHNTTATFLVQSYDTQHDSIRDACKLDRDGFMKKEKTFRQSHHYPPYGELCVIKYKNENETTLHNSIQALTKELLYLQQSYEYPDLTIYATPPLVYKKFGKFYYHIIILWPQDHVRPFMDIAFSKLQMRKRWFKIDWMANHIV